MTLTPFLALVLGGYAVFILVLGTYWVRCWIDAAKSPAKPVVD